MSVNYSIYVFYKAKHFFPLAIIYHSLRCIQIYTNATKEYHSEATSFLFNAHFKFKLLQS